MDHAARKPDILDEMLAAVGRRRSASMPLYITCVEVLDEFVEKIDPRSAQALAYTGFQAIKDAEGAVPATPSGMELFPAERAKTFGDDFDAEDLTVEEAAQLTLIGFMTIAAERLMNAEAEN